MTRHVSPPKKPVQSTFPDEAAPPKPQKGKGSFSARDFAVIYQGVMLGSNLLLVVSTPLKNISQNGNLPQIGMKIKKYLKPPTSNMLLVCKRILLDHHVIYVRLRCLKEATSNNCPIAPFLWKPNVDDAVDGHHINWFARLCPSKYIYLYIYIHIFI